jgi:hypothetical protein
MSAELQVAKRAHFLAAPSAPKKKRGQQAALVKTLNP